MKKLVLGIVLLLVPLNVSAQDTTKVDSTSYLVTKPNIQKIVCSDTSFTPKEYYSETEERIVQKYDSTSAVEWARMNNCIDFHVTVGHVTKETLYADTSKGDIEVTIDVLKPYKDSSPVFQNCQDENNVVSIRAERGRAYGTDSTSWNKERDSTAIDGWRIDALPPSGVDNIENPNWGGNFFSVPVNFCEVGTHYVWMRVQHSGGRGANNSIHMSSDGIDWNSYNDIQDGKDLRDVDSTEWIWVNQGNSSFGRTLDARMTLEVDTTGLRDLFFKRRETGLRIDHIFMTTEPTYEPY